MKTPEVGIDVAPTVVSHSPCLRVHLVAAVVGDIPVDDPVHLGRVLPTAGISGDLNRHVPLTIVHEDPERKGKPFAAYVLAANP